LQRPTARQFARLNEQDQALLQRLLDEPLEYVDHALFHAPDAERVLFGRAGDRPPAPDPGKASNGSRPGHPPATLGAAQEVLLFQQFNYARMRQVNLLRRYRGKRMLLERLRVLLMWAERAVVARCRIVEANMPLVLAMARRARPVGLDFSELISEGNFALLRSVDKFDCARGFKFSTYACRAILKSFSRVMMRNGRYRTRFPVEFEPALERSDYVDRQRQRLEGDCVEQIAAILADNRAALNDMEQQVIRQRFAIDSGESAPSKTLEQVGEMIGVTKERVRQIQNRALRKLRTALEEDLWG
jgi:RNA polymerase sigma factor (sigma-70 family)